MDTFLPRTFCCAFREKSGEDIAELLHFLLQISVGWGEAHLPSIVSEANGSQPVLPYIPASSIFCTAYPECTSSLDQAPQLLMEGIAWPRIRKALHIAHACVWLYLMKCRETFWHWNWNDGRMLDSTLSVICACSCKRGMNMTFVLAKKEWKQTLLLIYCCRCCSGCLSSVVCFLYVCLLSVVFVPSLCLLPSSCSLSVVFAVAVAVAVVVAVAVAVALVVNALGILMNFARCRSNHFGLYFLGVCHFQQLVWKLVLSCRRKASSVWSWTITTASMRLSFRHFWWQKHGCKQNKHGMPNALTAHRLDQFCLSWLADEARLTVSLMNVWMALWTSGEEIKKSTSSLLICHDGPKMPLGILRELDFGCRYVGILWILRLPAWPYCRWLHRLALWRHQSTRLVSYAWAPLQSHTNRCVP